MTKKDEIPPNLRAEMLRLSMEEGWSDQQVTDWLAAPPRGIRASRPTVNRLIRELMYPKPVVQVVDPEIPEPPLDDEDQLDHVQRDLFRAARMAHRARDFSAQVAASRELARIIFERRKAASNPDGSSSADKDAYVNSPPVGVKAPQFKVTNGN